MQINELARAKVNLCLHVTGQREDGYHLLDSIVVFADIGDQISIVPNTGFSLEIIGPFASDLDVSDDNLVLQAARLYSDCCQGAAITLTKNLPVASGIGGGSADAAATLRAISQLTGAPLPDDTGLSLGADVPVCLQEKTCRMQGIGDIITPISRLQKFHAVLACPKTGVATAGVFSTLKNKNNTPVADIQSGQDVYDFLTQQRNDLEKPSKEQNADINTCLSELSHTGASLARMSGSGATCFGLYTSDTQAEHAATMLVENYPDWWVKPCVLGS